MIWSGFLLGFFGGVHCVSMCGPFMLALSSKSYHIGHLMVHHIARWSGYILLALMFRLVVSPVSIFGAQQYVAIISGVLLLLFGLKSYIKPLRLFFDSFSNILAKLMPKSQSGIFPKISLGVLNGLLPCGLSFGAAILSVNFPTMWEASTFMVLFGLGTVPLLLAVSLLPRLGKVHIIQKINVWIPRLVIIAGVLLIIRGSGLGIPYFSPKFNAQTEKTDCCHINE